MPAHDLPNYHDVSVIGFTIKLRRPREVALLNATVPIIVSMVIAATVFTIWPEALNHAPISFEKRGVIHHIWHYSLLVGSLTALCGQFFATTRRLQLELVGLIVTNAAIGMNFIAVVSDGIKDYPSIPFFLQAASIVILLLRSYVIIVQPTVMLPTPVTNGVENGRE